MNTRGLRTKMLVFPALLSLLLTQCALPAGPPPTRRAATRVVIPAATALSASAVELPPATATAMPAEATTTATQVSSATATSAPPDEPSPTSTDAAPAEAQAIVAAIPALQSVVDGLEKPVYLTHAGDGSGMLYLLEQPGRIRILSKGLLARRPFLDIEDRVGSSGNEQGLLGLAFAPDFKDSGRFFVNYTDKDGDTIVAGFLAADDRRSANPDSEWQVLTIDQPYANHNGGQIKFGPDGYALHRHG